MDIVSVCNFDMMAESGDLRDKLQKSSIPKNKVHSYLYELLGNIIEENLKSNPESPENHQKTIEDLFPGEELNKVPIKQKSSEVKKIL